MSARFVKEHSPVTGVTTWFTEVLNDGRWTYVSGSVFTSEEPARDVFERVKQGGTGKQITIIEEAA